MSEDTTTETQTAGEIDAANTATSWAGAAGFADAESREILNLLSEGDDAGSCCGGSCCS